MDDEVLSFVNLRLLIDSIYKHVTRALFILSAFRISSTFHLYCLASMSMTLSLSPAWHFARRPGTLSLVPLLDTSVWPFSVEVSMAMERHGWNMMLDVRQESRNLKCLPACCSLWWRQSCFCGTKRRKTRGQCSFSPPCTAICPETKTLTSLAMHVFECLFKALTPTSCSQWDLQLSHCV